MQIADAKLYEQTQWELENDGYGSGRDLYNLPLSWWKAPAALL